MINSIDDYLKLLKKELGGCDRSTIQDALSDAAEHLKNSLDAIRETHPDILETEALPSIIAEYGFPKEIAAVYKQLESRVSPTLVSVPKPGKRPWYYRFLGVLIDPRTYGAFFYLLFSLVLGIFYFLWAVTGISVSLGLSWLIFGVIFFGGFVLSLRGISLMEGRLVEALLGIQMPRRPFFINANRGFWPKLKSLIKDKHTWFTLIYMIIMLPLGIIYFSVFVALFAVSIWLIVEPILQLVFNAPVTTNTTYYYTPGWLIPFSIIGGMVLFVLSMHLTRFTGKLHGRLAKTMLVRN